MKIEEKTISEIDKRRTMRYTLYKLVDRYLESLIFSVSVNVKILQEVSKF